MMYRKSGETLWIIFSGHIYLEKGIIKNQNRNRLFVDNFVSCSKEI